MTDDTYDDALRTIGEKLGAKRVIEKAKQWTSGGKKNSEANTESDLRIIDVGSAANENIRGNDAPPQFNSENDPNEMVSVATIAKRHSLDKKSMDRLRHALATWRKPSNVGEWIEVQDRKPRQAGYLYRLGSIQHLINAEISR